MSRIVIVVCKQCGKRVELEGDATNKNGWYYILRFNMGRVGNGVVNYEGEAELDFCGQKCAKAWFQSQLTLVATGKELTPEEMYDES